MPDLFARSPHPEKLRLPRPPDPRVTGLRRGVRIVVTGWVLCVIPLLAATIGYLLLYLPRINRSLWHSASQQAQLVTSAVTGHHYAIAAVDSVGVALLTLSFAGSLYIVTGLARRLATVALRSSPQSHPPGCGRRGLPGGLDGAGRVLGHPGAVRGW